MTLTDRREFLRRTGLSVAGLMALSGPLQGIFARGALASGSTGVAPNNGGYGPIGPLPDQTDGVVRLHLPEGFEYRSFTPTGTPTSDGVPRSPPARAGTGSSATTRSTDPSAPSATPPRPTTGGPAAAPSRSRSTSTRRRSSPG
jgi:hypothetical protein